MQFNFRLALAGAFVCAIFSAPLARADTLVTPSTEYLKRIKTSETVEPLDDTPFGESISLFTGAVSFRQTDISYPGIGPTITLARTYEASGSPTSYMNDRPMGDWDLSIPRIETLIPGRVLGLGGSWNVNGTLPAARCSKMGPVANPFAYGQAWWHGYQMVTPDGASQPLLLRGAANGLAPGNDTTRYPVVTPSHWMISCLPSTSNGMPGEAFLAVAPDGSKYTFDNLVYGAASETLLEPLLDQGPSGGGLFAPEKHGGPNRTPVPTVFNGIDVLIMARQQAQMQLTRIEDRFGNFLTYRYSAAGQLLDITASDGRKVALTWRTDAPLVDRITMQPGSAQARVWQYVYSAGVLVRVVQPDSSAWTFSMGSASAANVGSSFPSGVCGIRSAEQLSGGGVFMTLGHPGGLTGQFELGVRHHGRAQVPTTCLAAGYEPASEATPPIYDSLSLVARTFSGPGISTGTWRYSYSPVFASTATECASGQQCKDTKWVEITDPQLRTTHHTFSTRWGYMEGKLLGSVGGISVAGLDSPSGLQSDSSTYALPTAGPYPKSLGTLLVDPASGSNSTPTETLSPESLHQTIRQGVTFSRQNLSFDRFGQPLTVKRWSILGTRTETTTYAPVTNPWVLGLPNTVVDVASAKVMTRIDYDAGMLPIRSYGFGILRQSLAYNPNGTLASATDGRGSSTGLSDWYRGVPRLISFPDATRISATVDDTGNLRSVTNELGSITSYAYDLMGRIKSVTYPAGDSTAWNGSTQSFAPVLTAEYGIPAGHWKQVRQTGNGKVSTIYDASLRPLVTLTEDAGNAASKSFSVNRYDNAGQLVFSSYPVASLTSVSDVLNGTTSLYDPLGRPTQVRQSADLGDLVSTTDYLAGFQVRATNPRGYATTTAYQAFDAPSTDAPLKITLPEGVTTVIARDSFGKPSSITRSGLYLGVSSSAVRRYIYDANDRLCKTINPESGASLVDYDAAGNIAWSVDGSALTTLTCDRVSVVDAAKTYRQYDLRNRVTLVSTPGGTADLSTQYASDGLVTTLTASNPGGNFVTTTYGYNKRRLLTSESSANGSTLFTLGYGYSPNGHFSSTTYPDGLVVTTSPDALGRATAVASTTGQVFANAITYHANGAISGFKYGNLIQHTLTQNKRLLPLRSLDSKDGVARLDDSYRYDANGNVEFITDAAATGADNRTRNLGYDGLDRMLVADAPYQWGKGTYAYDALDNLRIADQGARQYRYNYAASTNRLSTITNPLGVAQITLGYDVNGNTTKKNAQLLVFDSANRLNEVTGKQVYRYDGQGRRVQTTDADGKTAFWIYSQSGQILYTAEGRRNQNLSYVYLGNSQVATVTTAWLPATTKTTSYEHTDALGSVVVESNGVAAVSKRNSFSPYGEAYGATSVDGTGYTGHVMDRDTGFTYMQQRYYDPQVARFLSVDPVSTVTTSGMAFSKYLYASGNPFHYVDPDGRSPIEIAFLVADAIELGSAVGSGAGIGMAVLNVAVDVVGVISPVPGISEAAHAIEALNKVEKGVEITLKAKDGWSAAQRAEAALKAKTLNNLAKEGKLTVTKSPARSTTSASARYKQAGGEVTKGKDVDHVHELQLGGSDATGNMLPLDSSVNRSFGAQIQQKTKSLESGTPVCGVKIDC